MIEENKSKLFQALTLLTLLLVVFVGAKIITEVKGYRFIGGGVAATNMISVSGDGEVLATPDIATISFTIQEEGKTVTAAQDLVSTKTKTTLAALSKVGIPDKDIKTDSYVSNPKYEYQQVNTPTIVCTNSYCPPYPGNQVITGYQVSQSVTITVRNLDLVNNTVSALGKAGVSNMYGPNFAIDKQDALQDEARKQAIDKARAKAEVLAKDLGVTLVRIVSFSEGGNYPIMYATKAVGLGAADSASVPAPVLPQGQQKITSNVTVTYEIR